MIYISINVSHIYFTNINANKLLLIFFFKILSSKSVLEMNRILILESSKILMMVNTRTVLPAKHQKNFQSTFSVKFMNCFKDNLRMKTVKLGMEGCVLEVETRRSQV